MTETLSEKLCKVAEIPKAYTVVINGGDLDYNFQKYSYKSKFTLLRAHFDDLVKNQEDAGIYTTWVGEIKEEFPDFESDTDSARFNFCKLLEITQNITAITFNVNNKFVEVGRGVGYTLPEAIIDFIDKVPNEGKQLKQALQEQEWRY